MSFFLGTQSAKARILRLIVTSVGTFLLFQFVSLYLSWPKQLVVGGVSIVLVMLLNRSSRSHVVTLSLMLISMAATLRYGWWRISMIVQFFGDESNNRFTIDSFLMLVLVSAEAYTIFIMVLGFMQTSAPLRRKPIPLPPEVESWPDVDVLIPTYNEPLSLVRYTALAAINIDYPPEKLHVYILDDGTRQDFAEFAEEAGVGYIVRTEHSHAKAGNINHALTTMHSPLVAIFDCDHVPTRSFLQVTVGWFLAEKKLAMLQTPHFFYSPDPFERNLLQYKTIPNEGELFYGVIQDGNDLWNATFFCGSCAVLRRTALDDVGGIATETVTEDAHTSLRMQKRGWNTAYINLPQAAGLATETLAAHVGQRVRWARGMIQILRTDNPMLATGMSFTQRLCYFNAMLHFLYAVPRLVFLCAPLIYMLAGRTIIPGYWVAILAYALPHLVISSLTNSRVQGNHRHSFWNEIYETVLAPYILLPTLLALINPKLGKFNVTDKGTTLSETTFDRHIAAPTTWLLALNFLGICVAPYRLLVTDPGHPGTVISNLVWICFNMVILGVAAAVANEQQQRRSSVRIPARISVGLHLEGGASVSGFTSDMSVGGASLQFEGNANLHMGDSVRLSFPQQTGDAQIGAKVVGLRGKELRLQFVAPTIAEQETLTCALYSRANSWISVRANIEADRPLISLGRVIRLSFTGFHQVLRGMLPRKKAVSVGKKAAAAAAGLLLCSILASTLVAQIPGAIPVSPVAAPSSLPDAIPALVPAGASPASSPRVAANVTLFTPQTEPVTPAGANEKIVFKDMGVRDAIDMAGPHSYYSLGFVLSHTLDPHRATLNLSYRFNPDASAGRGSLRISLNKTVIAEIAPPPQPANGRDFAFVALPVPADLLIRNNDLTFEFTGGKSASAIDIGATSTLLVAGDRIPFRNDLSLLPLPFFDADLQTATTIPFVFLTDPSPRTLQAAGIVASWLGILASAKPVRFTVSIGDIPPGNVIVFSDRPKLLSPSLQIPTGGPSLSVKTNPSDPEGSALILAGDDADQLLNVARALSLMKVSHPQPGAAVPPQGDSIRIGDFALPAPRQPDDAPRWIGTDRLTSLWTLSSKDALKSDGSRPLPVYLRVPPDLFYGETQNLNLHLNYRYNALPLATGSALRVFVNGSLINEAPLPPGTDSVERERSVLLPVAKMRPSSNTFLFNFDFVPANPAQDRNSAAQQLSGALLVNSYLDIRGLDRWASMPNLELFANAGYPFTRRADLADTTIVVPNIPSPKEIALLLYLLSHFGAQTGYPALRVVVAGPETVLGTQRDYLVLGKIDDQPAVTALDDKLPLTFDADGIHIRPAANQAASQLSALGRSLRSLWRKVIGDTTVVNELSASDHSNLEGTQAVVVGIQAPGSADRSIVTVSLRDDAAADAFADAFLERSQSSDIAQSVSLLRSGKFVSYAADTPAYHVGSLSNYRLMRIWLAEQFWILLILVVAFSLVLARYARDYLALLTASRLRIHTHN